MSDCPPECYICSDDTPPLYRVCACNRLVHKECFTRLVETVPSHRTHCPVCRSSNPGEVVRTAHHRIVVDVPLLLVADFNVVLTGAFLMWMLTIDAPKANKLVVSVRCFALVMCLLTSAWTACLHMHTRRLCGVAHRRLVEETTCILLPEPVVDV